MQSATSSSSSSSSSRARAISTRYLNNIQYKKLLSHFDHELFDQMSFVKFLTFLVYLPIGLTLMCIRLTFIVTLQVCASVLTKLKTSKLFLNLYMWCLGISIDTTSGSPFGSNGDQEQETRRIYVANHRTCLDFLLLKSKLVQCHRMNVAAPTSLTQVLVNLLNLEEGTTRSIKINNDNNSKTSPPLVTFPETLTTNGKYLLKFESNGFDGGDSNNITVVPTCIQVKRRVSFAPLNNNYVLANDLVNVLFTLFCPITVYRVTFLTAETKNQTESIEEYLQRVRTLIGDELKSKLSDYSTEDIKRLWFEYKQKRREIEERSSDEQSLADSSQNGAGDSMSFSDISKLALQIKDILPDVSYETIKTHVRASPTLDIDTIISSILDSPPPPPPADHSINSRTSSLPTMSSTNSHDLNSSLKNSKSSAIMENKKKSNVFKSYEERKFDLLNDARRRYLSKNPI